MKGIIYVLPTRVDNMLQAILDKVETHSIDWILFM